MKRPRIPPKRTARTYWIERRDQLETLCSPLRQDIVDTLAQMGPASVADLAERLGRQPESLYYHVRSLLDVELLLEDGERALPRHKEKLYTTPGRTMRIRYRRSNLHLHLRSLRATLRLGQRDLARFEPPAGGNLTLPRGGRVTGWVSESERAQITEHLMAVVRILTVARPRRDRSLHALTWIQAPLSAGRSGASRGEGG